ncbi:uncharacterized protein AtWU_05979 [Aspergillus tubingensis]|uniref:Uncharacterized protein n=1 Tax=Aspergillus niger TaxID=5061 RepID=A0A100I4R0_ASPNG|nr:voltage gated chloride channel family protein [Aspergillus tubingensis]GAQ34684.1 hypothetical protein AKAW_00373 [Aspergillus niger]GFN16178.1 voltage gated chloride channel family protein [Aspergillus tubingensis]
MPALQLLSTELENSGWENETLLNKIQTLMNQGLVMASRGAPDNRILSVEELAWFAKASYSIASRIFRSTKMEPVMHLLDISIKARHIVLSEHYLLCDSLKIAKIAIEARKEISVDEKTKHYSAIHRIGAHFRGLFKSQTVEHSTNAQYERWLSQHRTILALDLEASIFLKNWSGVCTIIEEASPFLDERLSSVFLDGILRSEGHLKAKVQAVKLTIHRNAWQTLLRTLHASLSPFLHNSTFIIQTLPRYIRCLFQLSLDAAEYQLAESILDQSLILVQERHAKTGNNDNLSLPGYPEDEIRWLSTVAFNRAVDYYLAAADADCRRWAGKAINLANMAKDDGALGRLLRGKLEMLT